MEISILSGLLDKGLLNVLPSTLSMLIVIYFVFKIMDMLLGLLKSWKNRNYKSGKMRDGLVKWVAEIIAILFVLISDLVLGLNSLLSGFTVALFIYKETGSIIENLYECGVDLPRPVVDKLEVFNVNQKNLNDKQEGGN